MESWIQRVETYIDQLQDLVEQLQVILRTAQVDSRDQGPQAVQASTQRLREQLDALEQKVAQRDQLLRSNDAPASGLTLIQKLSDANQTDLAAHADRVAEQVTKAHQSSMSLFVCQYHLSNLTTDLVRLLTGAEQTTTYSGTGATAPLPQGGLFNKSA